MQLKKWAVLIAAGALVASLALFGCSSGGSTSGDSSSSSTQQGQDSKPADSAPSYALISDGVLTAGTSPDYPPFENLENGKYVGFDIALTEAIAKEMGLDVEFKTLQFDGIIPAVAAGGQCDIGISGFSVDPDRAKEIDFTDTYYIDDQAIAAMKGGSITADNADTALNVAGVIIAVQSGTTGETYALENYPNATIQPYGNSTDAFAAMQAGQANAVCTNKAVVEQMLAKAYKDAEIVKAVATGEEYAIVVSQDNPELTAAINEAIAKLTEDGTIEALTQQYMG